MSRQIYIPYTDVVDPIIGKEIVELNHQPYENARPNPPLRKVALSAAILAGSFFMFSEPIAPPETITYDKWQQPIVQPYFKNTLIVPVIRQSYNITGWTGAKAITIKRPSSTLTDFPMLFKGTYNFLIGNYAAFYSDRSLTTLLGFERVYHNLLTGEVEYWVKIPSLSSSNNTVIYLAYGNNSIQNVANTWDSGYRSVWHLADGTNLSLVDSKNSVNGTNSGGNPIAGQIDGGVHFDGSSNADFGNNNDYTTGDMTISMWWKTGTTGSSYIISKMNGGAGTGGYLIYLNNPNFSNWTPWLYLETDGSNWKQVGFNNVQHADSVWRYFVFTRTGTTMTAYVNGSSAGQVTQAGGTLGSVTNALNLKFGSDSAGNFKHTGYLDEVRMSNIVRSAAWIATEYDNQSDPSNFYAIE